MISVFGSKSVGRVWMEFDGGAAGRHAVFGDVRMGGTGSRGVIPCVKGIRTDYREYGARAPSTDSAQRDAAWLSGDCGFSRYAIKDRQRVNPSGVLVAHRRISPTSCIEQAREFGCPPSGVRGYGLKTEAEG